MRNYKWVPVVLGIVLGLALLAQAVLAQEMPPAQAGLGQLFKEKLAANLGIDVRDLEEALKKAGQDALDEAVNRGILTPDRAERLKQAPQRWLGKSWRCLDRGGSGPGSQTGPAYILNSVASALGLSPEELREALKGGRSLAELAEEKGISVEELKQRIIQQAETLLNSAVAEGKITAERASEILEKLRSIDVDKFPPRLGWQLR